MEAEGGGGTIGLVAGLTRAALSLRRGLGTGRVLEGEGRIGLPFRCLLRKLDAACWTSHLSPRHEHKGLRDFVLPASRDSFALRIPLLLSSPTSPQPAEARLHGHFPCCFHRAVGSMEGSALPGKERDPRFAFSLSLLPAAGLSAVLAWRLATGGRGFPPSERLECGGVFLWFCFICMFARVILFSLLAFL